MLSVPSYNSMVDHLTRYPNHPTPQWHQKMFYYRDSAYSIVLPVQCTYLLTYMYIHIYMIYRCNIQGPQADLAFIKESLELSRYVGYM